jgi:hypothetical protein
LWLWRRLGHQVLHDGDANEDQKKGHQQPLLRAGIILRIVIFGQIRSQSVLSLGKLDLGKSGLGKLSPGNPGNRIVSAMGQRIAPHHTPRCQRRSPEKSVAGQRFRCVLGTARHETAGSRQQRRDQAFVELQQNCGQTRHDFVFPGPVCNAARSFSTSESSCANSIVITDFRGCSTTSSGRVNCATWRWTAARKRRRIRLRCTEPPSTLPTVNPTRGPGWLLPLSLRSR